MLDYVFGIVLQCCVHGSGRPKGHLIVRTGARRFRIEIAATQILVPPGLVCDLRRARCTETGVRHSEAIEQALLQ